MNIQGIIENEWSSFFMNTHKDQAKKLLHFNQNEFIRKFNQIYTGLDSEENQKELLEKLRLLKELENFQKDYNENSIHAKKLKQVNKTVDYLNNNYDDVFQDYLHEKINPAFVNQKETINYFENSLSEINQLKDIGFKVNKLCSDAVICNLKKKKISKKNLKKLHGNYYNLLSMIDNLKLNSNSNSVKLEKLELLQLKLLSNLKENFLDYQTKMRKTLRFSKITRIAAVITICGALYNLGSLAYKNSDSFAHTFDSIQSKYIDPVIDIFK